MGKKFIYGSLTIIVLLMIALYVGSCSGVINTNCDPHFTEDGILVRDSNSEAVFTPTAPGKIKFYIEVSGSMNGFFRRGIPTDFKTDVWQVLSFYAPIAPHVTELTNSGNIGRTFLLNDFRTKMNTGSFVSTASTRVPEMLNTIYSDFDAEAGEVAVLISDMKYSPVGQAAPGVLLEQYAIDISKILGQHGLAVSLILATSSFADKQGQVVCENSPYYYLVIGNPEQVAFVRNGISTLLKDKEHFIDNIETGFDYGPITYSFGISHGCYQMNMEDPTFCDYDPSSEDPFTIQLLVNLENYRWRLADEVVLRQSFKAQCLYGSEVTIGNIAIEVQNKDAQHLMHRTAVASIELKLSNMPTDSEIIEWSIDLPDADYTLFAPFVVGAVNDNDATKSYSVESFINGMFYGGIVNKLLKPQYILISKNY